MIATVESTGECGRCGQLGPIIRLDLTAVHESVDSCARCAVLMATALDMAMAIVPKEISSHPVISQTLNAVSEIRKFAGSIAEPN